MRRVAAQLWLRPLALSQRIRRTDQERPQADLAVDQRYVPEVLAIQEQQIQQKEDQPALAGVARVLDQIGGRMNLSRLVGDLCLCSWRRSTM